MKFDYKKPIRNRIYEFGAFAPVTHKEEAFQALETGRHYYNDIIRTYRDDAESQQVLEDAYSPDFEVLRQEYVSAVQALEAVEEQDKALKSSENMLALKVKEAKKGLEAKDLKAKLAAVKSERKEIRAQLKKAKARLKDVKDRQKTLRSELRAILQPHDEDRSRLLQERIEAHYAQEEAKGVVVDRDENGKVAKAGPHIQAALKEKVLAEMLDDPSRPEIWKLKFRRETDSFNTRKALRQNVDLHNTTYNLIIEQAEQAKKMAKGQLKFKRDRGEGRLGGQVMGRGKEPHLPTEGLFAKTQKEFDTYVGTNPLIAPLPEGTWDAKGNRVSRKAGHTFIKILLGRDPKTQVMATFPIVLHRRLPEGTVRYVWIRSFRQGAKLKYRLNITICSDQFRKDKAVGSGVVALYPEFCMSKDLRDVQVATLVDHRQNVSSLSIEGVLVDRLALSGALAKDKDIEQTWQSAKDKLFETAKKDLRAYLNTPKVRTKMQKFLAKTLESRKVKGVVMSPEERATSFLRDLLKWREPSKLNLWVSLWLKATVDADTVNQLWAAWKEERFNGHKRGKEVCLMASNPRKDLFCPEPSDDSDTPKDLIQSWLAGQGVTDPEQQMALYMEWWRRKDVHLRELICNTRVKAQNHRREEYRKESDKLSQMYGVILVPKQDLATLAKTPDEDAEGNDISRVAQKKMARVRRAACLSKLKETLKSAFGERYVEVDCKENKEWSTLTSEEKCQALLEAYEEEVGRTPLAAE